MNLELDHIFILVKPEAKDADLLLSIGMVESFSRDHKGQGTSNRRFEFSNGMLEFLWVRDSEEAMNGPARDLQFPKRADSQTSSPFGIILNRKDETFLDQPFSGWQYQPDYFKPPMAFHVGMNSSNLLEPLCIYAPFITPCVRKVEQGTFNSLSCVKVCTTVDKPSDVLAEVHKADRLSISYGDQHLMELTLDGNKLGLSKDFRPEIPLIIHW
jgi:hypothetical protein